MALGLDEVLGRNAMKSACILLAMSILVCGISTTQAQTTIDVAKITCRQFLLGHVGGSTRSVANWLSGYYNGKRGNTVIEVGSMQNNVRDLERYCRKNHEMPVMDAAKNALGAEK
jgi:acid stress chaperone HdeB